MKTKWLYWGATGLLSLMYVAGGVMYLSDISGIQAIFVTFGYPPYLVPILGAAKLAAAATILSRFSVALSDLSYPGMFFHLLLAISAHVNVGDGGFVPAIAALVALVVSVSTQNAARRKPSPYGAFPSRGTASTHRA